MNLQIAISELLYLHDCVIIPGFGGFITRYHPATIHPTQHQFSAPFKAILFNKSLSTNDGLLANHISKTQGISYTDAISGIEKQVKEFDAALRSGKRIQLASIGELYLDVEKSLQFSPDGSCNYLLDSYGLTEFQSAAIRRTEDYTKVIDLPSAIQSEKRKSGTLKKVLIAASLIPFVALMGYLPFHSGLANQSLSNLNPFAGEGAPTGSYNQRSHEVKEINLREISFVFPNPAHTVSAEEPAHVKAEATPASVQSVPVSSVTPSGGKYMLIAGCFQSEENASRFIADLQGKGISAVFAGKTPQGLFRVSCGQFDQKEEAVAMQNDLAQKSTAAWILAQ